MFEHFRDEEVKSDDKAQGVTLGVDGKESRGGSDWVKKSRGREAMVLVIQMRVKVKEV